MNERAAKNLKAQTSPKRLRSLTKARKFQFQLRAPDRVGEDKGEVMQQFAALLRKDQKPVRYLVVDDSVFARKNLIKMIEQFGGEVAGEAGGGPSGNREKKCSHAAHLP